MIRKTRIGWPSQARLDAGWITGTWFEPVERGTVEHAAAVPGRAARHEGATNLVIRMGSRKRERPTGHRPAD
jgi:hypothetical protein